MRNRFHSLCPYFAMFPEEFADRWIQALTKRNDLVLDPFCGRGTAPFQAALLGRRAIGCDVNPVAYCVTRAKTDPPQRESVVARLRVLERDFDADEFEATRQRMPDFYRRAYSPSTLRQLLYLRSALKWRTGRVDCMVAALVLGSLHGETKDSKSYFSNQMPRTIATKPQYSIRYWEKNGQKAPRRNVFEVLRERVDFRYESETPRKKGVTFESDMRRLPTLLGKDAGRVRCVVTSPPYMNVTNYAEDQWLRLWFLGGPANPSYRCIADERHHGETNYWAMIADMWRMLSVVMAPTGNIVVRIGCSHNPKKLRERFEGSAAMFCPRPVELATYEESPIRRKQTDRFRPGSAGCKRELDFHFVIN